MQMRNGVRNGLVGLLLMGVWAVAMGSQETAGGNAGGATDDIRLLDDARLELRSTGSAYFARFIHVYDAALYASAETTAADLLESNTAKCLALSYHVDLKGSDIRKAAEKVLERQHGDLTAWRPDLDRLHAAYQDVGKGDEYALCHHPRRGTELLLNGAALTRIETPGFDVLYFGIWLGEDAISASLREDLVGFE